ncbi:MAG: hypothetical protein U9O06_12475 [Euryarchaeota archaeon]|nr:hypothetical protein [Euryarchaeota archaeon]
MSLQQRLPISERSIRSIVISVGISLLYTAIVLGYSVHPATDISVSGTLWHAVGLFSVMALGTVGVPLLVWLRYGIRSPGVLLAVILLFWHVLVAFPPLGSGQGDSPGFFFVFAWMPFYLVAYGLLAGGEYWVRGRTHSLTTPGT